MTLISCIGSVCPDMEQGFLQQGFTRAHECLYEIFTTFVLLFCEITTVIRFCQQDVLFYRDGLMILAGLWRKFVDCRGNYIEKCCVDLQA